MARGKHDRLTDELQRVCGSLFQSFESQILIVPSSLVELIVLNVGLSAGILSQRVFSMFVLEALLLTFMTTPAVEFLYPPQFRVRAAAIGSNFANVREGVHNAEAPGERSQLSQNSGEKRTRFTVVLDKLEHLPGMMALTQLILPPPSPNSDMDSRSGNTSPTPSSSSSTVLLDAIRLIELSDRTSAVMKSSNVEALVITDPLLDIFGTFGALHGVPVSSSLSIVPSDDLGSCVSEHAKRNESHLVLVPWLPPHYDIGSVPAVAQDHTGPTTPRAVNSSNPFEALFRSRALAAEDRDVSLSHSHFIRSLFGTSKTDVALYVDRHMPGDLPKNSHVGSYQLLVPFFGGPDDRLALEFAVQLCANPKISATVLKVTKAEMPVARTGSSSEKPQVLADERLGDAHVQQNSTTIASVSFLSLLVSPLLN